MERPGANDKAASIARLLPLHRPLDTSLETPLHTVSMSMIQRIQSRIANEVNDFRVSPSPPFPTRRCWFCCLFLSSCDLRSVDPVPVAETRGLVVVSRLVLANPAKPPAYRPAEPDDRRGWAQARHTGRHITFTRAFSLICNDALSANRFPRARGRGSGDIVRAKRLHITSIA
jgi:hypothetical protein